MELTRSYTGWPGYVTLSMQACAKMFFVACSLSTRRRYNRKRRFYVRLTVGFALWWTAAVIVALPLGVFDATRRHAVGIHALNKALDLTAYATLLLLYNPSTRCNRSFPFHARTTDMSLAKAGIAYRSPSRNSMRRVHAQRPACADPGPSNANTSIGTGRTPGMPAARSPTARQRRVSFTPTAPDTVLVRTISMLGGGDVGHRADGSRAGAVLDDGGQWDGVDGGSVAAHDGAGSWTEHQSSLSDDERALPRQAVHEGSEAGEHGDEGGRAPLDHPPYWHPFGAHALVQPVRQQRCANHMLRADLEGAEPRAAARGIRRRRARGSEHDGDSQSFSLRRVRDLTQRISSCTTLLRRLACDLEDATDDFSFDGALLRWRSLAPVRVTNTAHADEHDLLLPVDDADDSIELADNATQLQTVHGADAPLPLPRTGPVSSAVVALHDAQEASQWATGGAGEGGGEGGWPGVLRASAAEPRAVRLFARLPVSPGTPGSYQPQPVRSPRTPLSVSSPVAGSGGDRMPPLPKRLSQHSGGSDAAESSASFMGGRSRQSSDPEGMANAARQLAPPLRFGQCAALTQSPVSGPPVMSGAGGASGQPLPPPGQPPVTSASPARMRSGVVRHLPPVLEL